MLVLLAWHLSYLGALCLYISKWLLLSNCSVSIISYQNIRCEGILNYNNLYTYFYNAFIFRVWWPFFVVLFYILAPVPTIIARRYTDDSGNNPNRCLELAIFMTMGFVVSSFALPIILARSPANDPVVQLNYAYFSVRLFKYISK